MVIGKIHIVAFATSLIKALGVLKILIDEPDFECLMIDATNVKVHAHTAGARSGNQMISYTKGGAQPIAAQACTLDAEHLLTDRAYDIAVVT